MAKSGGIKNQAIREQVTALVREGKTTREIALELDYSTQRIWELRNELGLPTDKQRRLAEAQAKAAS